MFLRRASIVGIGVCCLASGIALAEGELSKFGGIKIYGDLAYNRAENEISGNQILIIPSTDGDKVLWRVADGQFSPPLLLDAVKQGDVLTIAVPNAGNWTLRVRGTSLDAVSSRGVRLRLSQTLPK
jgi:hypothetical protein